MKIETKQTQTQNIQNRLNGTKTNSIKPIFREIPDEFISETAESAGEHNGLVGYIAAGVAAIGAGFAFFRNRKARIAKQIAENEKEVIKKAKSEAEDVLARLKAENEALNKSIDEWNEAILSPTKNKGSNKTGKSQAYSSGSSKTEGNRAGSRTNTGSSSGKTGTKGERATVNNAQNSANIYMSEEDKKYLEKAKQELLDMVDKSAVNKDIKKELVNEIEECAESILNGSNSVEDKKISLDLLKGIIGDQLEMTGKWEALQKEMYDMKEVIEYNYSTQKRKELAQKKGFARILGYQTQKDFLNEKLIKPLKKNSETPNIILMYGPKGTGKTLFGKAVAHEGNANHISIDVSIFPEENLQNLKDAVNKSKECFEKTGKRSILLLNEIDGVECNKEYIDIINNLSKKYHATLLATTNYPKKVDTGILNANNSEKLYMPTSTKEDITKILEYVLKDFSEQGVNFKELAKILTDKTNGAAYSNAQIYEVADQIVKLHYGEILDKKVKQKITSNLAPISEREIIERLNKIEPDISKEVIDSYKNIF
jgi:ATP-dependent 26S proteasome regulatory subunit